ncbi:GHKL domain-containing protein [Clostridium gasigenes]|uniref:sensor histidine kinase n=1 Tax=Clostridium gasigenes TaxID=94869 RepID=UPI0014382A07|nr:GHKL domain-containing protein [Clostridium gasigenes]MBU3130982.1 GHKL domain-containing protein [Clostridium gasigenes]NKF07268.1 GHKL domain-containing protein [Clostridium gasigenes]QSW18245.1 GHKL domain-containing protein [Clostridium gasigenes]
MLEIIQKFVVNSIELTILMILWSRFSFKYENNWFKNLFIILIGSSIMVVTTNTNTYLNIIISYLSVIFSAKFIYKRLFIRTILEFIIFFFINIVLQAIIMAFVNLIGLTYSDNFIWKSSLLLFELSFVIVILKYIFSEKVRIFFELESKILYYFVINLGLYILFSKFIWEYNENIILNNLIAYILIILMLLSLNIFLYYYIVKISEDKKVAELQNKYNPILIDIVEETRRKQHDFKNHLNTINAIVEIASEKELKNELKKYITSSKYLNKSIEDIMYIDNIVIKAIIYNKLCEADRLNIKLLVNVKNDSLENSLKDYEISDILNNLLDNAFEAVIDSTNDKVVILNICTEGSTNIIEIRNSGITINLDNIKTIFERGFSTKKGKNRGYGLYNIKKIAEKNGGNVQLFFEDNYTVFKILFK